MFIIVFEIDGNVLSFEPILLKICTPNICFLFHKSKRLRTLRGFAA